MKTAIDISVKLSSSFHSEEKKPSEIPGIRFPRLRSFSGERFICARGDNIKTSSGFLFLRRRTLIMSMRDAPEGVNGFCVINVSRMKRFWQIKTTLFSSHFQMDFNWVLILNIVTKIINVEIEMLRKKIASRRRKKKEYQI